MSTYGPSGATYGGPESSYGELTEGDPSSTLITAAVYDRANLADPYAILEHSFARKWRDALNEAGAGSLSVQNTDPDLSQLDFGRIVIFSHRTIPRWSMVVGRHERMSIAPGEDHDQITVVSGLGLESVLGEAIIYPQNGAGNIPFYDVRYFNFAVPEYDDSAWVAPTEVSEQPFSVPPAPGYIRARPTGFPNTTTMGIWSSAMPGDDVQPTAIGYFRAELTLAEDINASIYLAGDSATELWVDGLLVSQFSNWWICQKVDISLSAGTHLIAARVANDDFNAYGDPVISGGPWDPPLNHFNVGELILAAYSVDITTGANVDLLLETNLTDWVVLEQAPDDPPPGFTPGEVVNILVDEAQDRGALLDLTRTWTDSLDSSGASWPITADITFRVGINYYNALRQLTEGYLDFNMAAAELELSLWVARGSDVSSTAQLQGGVNLSSLRHTTEG